MVPESLRKVGWFFVIWLMSVFALGVVAYAIRSAIHA